MMSSPNPDQARSSWQAQPYQQFQPQLPNPYYPQPPSNIPYYGHYAPGPVKYSQPYIGEPSPVSFIAELPAPLPPAPPTATPNDQLREDELLAHKLQRLEVADARRKSSSAVSHQHRRPVSMAELSPQHSAPLIHQRSAHTLRPHAQSLSYNASAWIPEPPVPGPDRRSPSSLPEIVVDTPHHNVTRHPSQRENFPIPVLQDQMLVQPSVFSIEPANLSSYLEQHRQVPYPPQWVLPPVVSTLYSFQGGKVESSSTWLDTPDTCSWRTTRPVDYAYNPTPPSYMFRFKSSSGSFRSPKLTWTMNGPEELSNATDKKTKTRPNTWTYELKLDQKTHLRKSEVLSHGKLKAILTTYVHASNYDSLRFIGPDGRAYMWVSSSRVSSIGGSRYDTIRHALFVATGNVPDPLYGQIVADHTFWDGYVDHNERHGGTQCNGCEKEPIQGLRWRCRTCASHDVCDTCHTLASDGQFGASMLPTCDLSLVNLPDEALYIRSSTVDPSLVVATLQVLKDWEKDTFRNEKKVNISGFLASEEAARKCDLGAMSYWKAGDWGKNSREAHACGTRVKAHEIINSVELAAGGSGRMGGVAFSLGGNAALSGRGAGHGGGMTHLVGGDHGGGSGGDSGGCGGGGGGGGGS
ncbi:hypothetical protein J1614_009899 [Plenodomus biglobosus]|nr:hypothetical protein J1614_009899 [Plenodomus biglobosus]